MRDDNLNIETTHRGGQNTQNKIGETWIKGTLQTGTIIT